MSEYIYCLFDKETVKFGVFNSAFVSRFLEISEIYIGDYDFVRSSEDDSLVGIAFGGRFLHKDDEEVEIKYFDALSINKFVCDWDGYYSCFCKKRLLSGEIEVEVRQVLGSRLFVGGDSFMIELPVWDDEVLLLAQ